MPQVSIVILNYNTFELTCICIESIYAHTKKVDFEIILLDNGSSEVKPQEFKKRFNDIQLIESGTNLGFSKGNNVAIKQCKSEVILLLNSDTYFTEDSISICYEQLLLNTNTGALTCKLKFPDGRLQHNCQSFPSTIKALLEKSRVHKILPESKVANYLQGFYWDYTISGTPNWIWGTFFMFKIAILNQLPDQKLNDTYFMYLEDMQWCFDIRKAGLNIAYTPLTSIVHLHGGSRGDSESQLKINYQNFIKNNYSKIKYLIYKILN